MKFFRLLFLSAAAILAAQCPAAAGARDRGPDLKKTLSEAGLEYDGTRTFRTDKNYRRGDWSGARPVFWTLTASDGAVKLRLELTKNITRAQAEKTMDERFSRIDALYSGAAAYPGMVTTEFEVPRALRPVDIKAGPSGNRAKALAATSGMAYGAGAEDLVSYRGILGYLYCDSPAPGADAAARAGTLAQIELFFPKKDFKLETARQEFDKVHCAGDIPERGKPK
jgi:hypothetical protein